jgi:hypothetical protein
MKLIDELTLEERRQLAPASRKARPAAKHRAESHKLARRRRELHETQKLFISRNRKNRNA